MLSHEELLKRYRELLTLQKTLACCADWGDGCGDDDYNTGYYLCPNCTLRHDQGIDFKIEEFESFLKITPEDRAVIIAGGDPTIH